MEIVLFLGKKEKIWSSSEVFKKREGSSPECFTPKRAIGFTGKSGQDSALRLKQKGTPAFILKFRLLAMKR
ncbi:hypothetical protein [Alkalihalobacterium bogoriense]|uniref:hypothetical protein n=1 Tax=Alkalihalobacterium bogoriense TaxID=246272 RepID=UPI0004793CD3|nr:hypothetical protein [Alkalihalobacterium bogoriense]